MKKETLTTVLLWLFTIAFLFLTVNLVKAQCTVSYERLLRELGPPTETVMLPDETLILSYNETEFFYLDPQTHCVTLQRSYITNMKARWFMKRFSRRYEYQNGWYKVDNVMARVVMEGGEYLLEVKY